MLGVDGIAKIRYDYPRSRPLPYMGGEIGIGIVDIGVDVEQFTYLLSNGFVEVEQIVPAAFKERTQIVFVIHEEGRVAIGRLKGVPMQVTPVAVVADADIIYK